MATLVPVDHDPFAEAKGPTLVPVDHDPFATAPGAPAEPSVNPAIADLLKVRSDIPTSVPSTGERAGRALMLGTQDVGRGLAHSALGFGDLANTGLNLGLALADRGSRAAGGPAIDFRFKMPSEIAIEGASDLASKIGVPLATPENARERLVGNMIDYGTQGALMGGALAARGLAREAQMAASGEKGVLPQALDEAAKVYAAAPEKAYARDLVGGLGAGAGVSGAQEYLPSEVRAYGGGAVGALADLLAALAGGGAGIGGMHAAEATGRQIATQAGKPFGLSLAKDIPVDPAGDLRPYTNRSADMAAEVYQGAMTNPGMAPALLAENRATIEPVLGKRTPTSGAMMEEPGIVSLERRIAMENPNPTIRRDQQLAAGVRDAVEGAGGRGDPANLVAAAADEAARLRTGAQQGAEAVVVPVQQRVGQLEGRAGTVAGIRRNDAGALAPFEGADAAANASRRLDRALVDETYLPARAQKNALYEAVDPNRTTMVDATPMVDAARAVREGVNDLGPQGQQLPGEFLQRIERIAPDVEMQPSPILGADGRPVMREVNNGGTGQAALGDVVDLQKYTGAARTAARQSGNFDLADAIGDLAGGARRVAEQSPDAAVAAANYAENFAPRFRGARGDAVGEFTKKVDRDGTRSTTPPSETAATFLSGPESAAAFTRAMAGSEAGPAAQAAAREWLLSDMARHGVIDGRSGAIRPDRVRQWLAARPAEVLDAAPGLRQEVEQMAARAQRGERIAGQVDRDLRGARDRLRQTERDASRSVQVVDDQVNKGALGMVLNADPDKTVANVMSNSNRSARMLDDLARLTVNDADARAGLKAAVRDYMLDAMTTTAREKLPAGDSRTPVSYAKMSNLMKEHEQSLAKVFTPEEMNSLRVVQKALELQNLERVRVRSGSDSVEKLTQGGIESFLQTPLGKSTEAVLRLKFGMLKGGGMVAMMRRYMFGMTPEDGMRARELLERAAFDPDLAMVLATRKIPPGSPKYDNTVQRALAGMAGGRGAEESGDEP